jgi:hypothetical protein
MSHFQVDALAGAPQCIDTLTLNHRDTSVIASHVVTLWQHVAIEVLTAEETSVKGSQWMNHFVSVLCSVSAPLTLHMENSQLIKVCRVLSVFITYPRQNIGTELD